MVFVEGSAFRNTKTIHQLAARHTRNGSYRSAKETIPRQSQLGLKVSYDSDRCSSVSALSIGKGGLALGLPVLHLADRLRQAKQRQRKDCGVDQAQADSWA